MYRRIRTVTLALLSASVLVLATGVNADTIYVCWDGSGDYLTIQEGIDAAFDGDEVVVCDGTYTGPGNKDLDFHGKAIAVRSANGPENCVINCQGSDSDPHRGFHFHSGETAASVVDSFTIKNGRVAEGAGIYCINDSSPTITNCTITGNKAWTSEGGIGGGVNCRNNSNPTITNCRISGNSASGWDGVGGGVYCWQASPTITNCTISDNFAADVDGGISCVYGSPTITNCTISGNSAYRSTGGVSCTNSNATITNCTISGNRAYAYSQGGNVGGVSCGQGSPTITNCTISGNSASGKFGHAGGVRCRSNSNATITNCTISGNSALLGAGMYNQSSNPTVTNCTFSGNSANECGGVWASPDTRLTNCIAWANSDAGGTGESAQVSGNPIVNYCCIQGWTGDLGGTGNIGADPLFAHPEDDDFHLSSGSPCIDAADNTAVPADTFDLDEDGDTDEPIPFDLDGNPRFVDDPGADDTGNGSPPIVDMGAYEFQACPGDIDGDGDTDHADLGALLGAWESEPGDPHWNPDADLDGDGWVGHTDLAILLGGWGCGT